MAQKIQTLFVDDLDVSQATPEPSLLHQLGLVQADRGLHQRVIESSPMVLMEASTRTRSGAR
jgi:hypothetical protein